MTFVDTSGLMLLHDWRDRHCLDAQTYFEAAARKVTTSYVLAEFVALADARGLPRQPTLHFLRDIVTNPTVEIVWVDEALHAEAMELLWDRLGKR